MTHPASRLTTPALRPMTALALALAVAAPAPARAQSLDGARLMRDLSVLAHDSMQGRATGTEGAARARAFLVRELAAGGVETLGGSYEHAFGDAGARGINLVGRVAGTDPAAPFIVLTAHYDHEGIRGGEIYNGADDNASGVVTALALARVVVARPLHHGLLVVLTDAEESGLRGARAFVADPPVGRERLALNVNLDMVSRTGGELWAAGTAHTPALRPVLEGVAAGAPLTLRLGHDRSGAPEGADWTDSSDHGPFHRAGIPFVYFGVEDHPDYHRPTDDVDNVDPEDFAAAAETIMTALRALDEALPSIRGRSR